MHGTKYLVMLPVTMYGKITFTFLDVNKCAYVMVCNLTTKGEPNGAHVNNK